MTSAPSGHFDLRRVVLKWENCCEPSARFSHSLRWVGLTFLLLAAVPATAEQTSLQLHGTPIEGGLMHGSAGPGAEVWLDSEPVPVSPEGRFAFGFHRDTKPKALLRVVFADGREERRTLDVAQRDYDVQRIDGLEPSKVTPSEEDLARIHEEQKLIDAARAKLLGHAFFAEQPFMWPATGRISGVYGSQRILNGKPRNPHYGLDIAAPAGAPVVAPADAVVTLAHDGMFFSGKTLILDHGMGISSVMIHLSEIAVEEGQRVVRGQLVGRVGATGRATGPHLHWGMNWHSKARLDPQLLLGPMPE